MVTLVEKEKLPVQTLITLLKSRFRHNCEYQYFKIITIKKITLKSKFRQNFFLKVKKVLALPL